MSSKTHQEDCFLSGREATLEPLKEGLDSSLASVCLKTPVLPLYAQFLLPFTGSGFPLTQFRYKIRPRESSPGLLSIARWEGGHAAPGTRKNTHYY